MKKLLVLFAFSSLFLTACSSPKKIDVVKDPNELPPSVMQPVSGSGATEGSFGWGEIQSAPMPATMK